MEKWKGRVAVVTGSSAGIGYAIAECLVKHGMKVVGCSRNTQEIEKLALKLQGAPGELSALQCDVSKEADVIFVFSEARKLFGRLDVCINNAGLAHRAPLLSGEAEDWKHMLEVNVYGVAVCCREAVKCMKESNVDDGLIININSIMGHFLLGSPLNNFYGISKHALTTMTKGLRTELRQAKSNIRITQLSPGTTKTEFSKRMRNLTDNETTDLYANKPHMTSEDVAEAVMFVLSAPPHVQVQDMIFGHTQE